MKTSKICLIVAIDQSNGMGKNNTIPWHISSDLKRFKEKTSGHPIIMGRKTFESIGKPLPNRTNIIISRDISYTVDGATVVHSLVEALRVADKETSGEIFVIGGGQIFQEAIKLADKLYITLVRGDYHCDTFFPGYSMFKKVLYKEERKEKEYSFMYLDLEK